MQLVTRSNEEIFTRRAVMLGATQVVLLAALAGRLGWLQIAQSDHYRGLSDRNRLQVDLLPPQRGRIFDRNGKDLARSVPKYNLYVLPEHAHDLEETILRLSKFTPLEYEKIEKLRERALSSQRFVPFEARSDLSWKEVSRIESRIADLPGVSIELSAQRIYSFRFRVAHVVGYVSLPSEREIKKNRLYYVPGFTLGKSGVERRYEGDLRGVEGESRFEVDAAGRKIGEVSRTPPQNGREIWLSLDMRLQEFMYKRLAGEKRAAATLMDVHTGEIMAMVSIPSYDPNLFAQGIDHASWQSLSTHPHFPLTNKVISGVYAPGSLFKIAVALAALEAGLDPTTVHTCKGSLKHGRRRFHCWRRRGHGDMELVDALRESCDVWFYRTAITLGIDIIGKYAQLLGLGHRAKIDLPEERNGLMPSKIWKLRKYGRRWQISDTLLSAIGQGYVLSTPLQLAVQTARIVNGGFAVEPRVTILPEFRRRLFDQGQSPYRSLGVSASSLAILRAALDEVVNHPKGTAYASRLYNKRYAIGGKTGTSQVRRISKQERKSGILRNENISWLRRDHALFSGFIPVEQPQWAVTVLIEHGGSGASVAAPYARDFLDFAHRNLIPSFAPPKI